MKLAARKAAKAIVLKREQLTSEHLRADPLRKLFPDIEQLRIELLFHDPETHLPPPSPQLRTLFSAVRGSLGILPNGADAEHPYCGCLSPAYAASWQRRCPPNGEEPTAASAVHLPYEHSCVDHG